MRPARLLCALLLAACGLAPSAAARPAGGAAEVVVIYDASASMTQQVDGEARFVIARKALSDLARSWPAEMAVGLIAYGHRVSTGEGKSKACRDIEVLIAPGAVDREGFIRQVATIEPRGYTPIEASLRQAADLMSWREQPATVVLISDGVESCDGDPCRAAAELAQKGISFTAHVVGFDLQGADRQRLSCISEQTNGLFVQASDAEGLRSALAQIQIAIEEPPVELHAPARVTIGQAFDVAWSLARDPRDLVVLLPAGAPEGASDGALEVGATTSAEVRAPADPGSYEVRYVLRETGATLARVAVEALPATISLQAPLQTVIGAEVEVSWSSSIHPEDVISIAPAGAREDWRGGGFAIGNLDRGVLRAPSKVGVYEIRYALGAGGGTIARARLEVYGAEVLLQGPERVKAGEIFSVAWRGAVNSRDSIIIVPEGAADGRAGYGFVIGAAASGSLTAPVEPGPYEIRYVLSEDLKTIARIPIIVAR
ncbi:VWA domain-containing protein [Neomegalonema sp.]|uniref:vWA domain-containing protein n=1 Tax=Neomegalonema sp. TaxID=2039713 RepID=UPI002639F35C|nr:VWA domain-containing protein [Neomegalonema sp.]MDD2867266.1 VWA domain-containing protein [Neomegalonema sp.]